MSRIYQEPGGAEPDARSHGIASARQTLSPADVLWANQPGEGPVQTGSRRIVYIHQHFRLPSEAGGGRPWEFARRLATDGFDVRIVAGGAQARVLRATGVTVHYIAAPFESSGSTAHRLAQALRFAASSVLTTIRLKPDLVYASSTPLTVLIPAIAGSIAWRARLIFEVRDVWPTVLIKLGLLRNPLLIFAARTLEATGYHLAHQVVALSPDMASDVRAVNKRVPITVIPNASDVDMADLNEPATRTIPLVYAGSLNTIYDAPWIAHLIAILANSETAHHMQVMGDGAGLPEMRRILSLAHLDPNRHLLGSQPKRDAIAMLGRAQLSLSSVVDNPALHGSSLNKVFDSLATGTPIVFNHQGWLQERVVDAGAGWLISRDLAEAARQIDDILRDPDALAVAGTRARALAVGEFSRDTSYSRLRELIDRTFTQPKS